MEVQAKSGFLSPRDNDHDDESNAETILDAQGDLAFSLHGGAGVHQESSLMPLLLLLPKEMR